MVACRAFENREKLLYATVIQAACDCFDFHVLCFERQLSNWNDSQMENSQLVLSRAHTHTHQRPAAVSQQQNA